MLNARGQRSLGLNCPKLLGWTVDLLDTGEANFPRFQPVRTEQKRCAKTIRISALKKTGKKRKSKKTTFRIHKFCRIFRLQQKRRDQRFLPAKSTGGDVFFWERFPTRSQTMSEVSSGQSVVREI